MKTLNFDSREEWLNFRLGKISGSRLKDIIVKRGTGKKKGYYELIAERIAVPADDENPMDRGTRLEEEALARFEQETKKKVDTSLIVWQSEESENIILSPDGVISEYEAVEVKCLSSASHIEAWLTQEIPSEYQDQALQYFVVNPSLETLYFTFYDPRIPAKDFFVIEVGRDKEKVEEYLAYEKSIMEEINSIVTKLTF
jgi:putative phage-type endonuclease